MFGQRKFCSFVLLAIAILGTVFCLSGCKDEGYYCDYCKQEYEGKPHYVQEGTVDFTLCDACYQKRLPPIESLSGTQLEPYRYQFSPVATAVYRADGTEVAIDVDDARLVRLLNLLAYSHSNWLDAYRFGYVEEAEINGYLAEDAPMLEVTFRHAEGSSGSAIGDTPKIVICGDSFLAFVDPAMENNGKEGLFAERYWPYGKLAERNASENLSYDGWGTGYWIDLLEYCGF